MRFIHSVLLQLKLVRTKGKAWEVLDRGDVRGMWDLASSRPRCHDNNNLLETVPSSTFPIGKQKAAVPLAGVGCVETHMHTDASAHVEN